MKNLITLKILLLLSLPALSCDEISGEYQSVSETHWNFILKIQGKTVELEYSLYWYDENNERKEEIALNFGTCTKKGKGYMLNFSDRTIDIIFEKNMSHAPFGGDGSSTGITGLFFKDRKVQLWNLPK